MTDLPADVEAAFRATVAWYRDLDEGSEPRRYFEYVDHEGLVDAGARWLFEAVIVDHETAAVKQIVLDSSGEVHRYWWRHLEDDAGGLTDQALDGAEPGLKPVTRSAFYALWKSGVDE
ncbi:hypothetical protein [Amycolatopsis eburnea]|uniref:Uncharacterized protein n=1 Tax=Amycolatopsis eburnea TaxID=2267691 RepID=A0A3R9FH91_9PSEU|nr:hypothetical protein [Amycolatopsis eburnea]RSD10500.1 hypothetical protein EIY87_37275 [Amycolatopsis eburnea]